MPDLYVDQVPRLEKFREDHPEIDILTPLQSHSAFWRAYRDGELLCVQHDLGWLLDFLEKMIARD